MIEIKPFDYTQLHEPVLLRRYGKILQHTAMKLYKPLVIDGAENIPETGAVIVTCNHIHASDPVPIMLAAYPKRELHFMAKLELFNNSVAAGLLRRMGAFPVKRGIGSRKAIDYALRLLDDGRALGIFPEGTRHPGERPQEPRSGIAKLAYSSGAAVLPCAIYSPSKKSFGVPMYLRVGKLIENGELDFGDGKSSGRKRAAAQIMAEITTLWEALRTECVER